MRIFIFSLLLSLSVPIHAGIGNLLPKVQELETNSKIFPINKVQIISPILNPELEDLIDELGGTIQTKSNYKLRLQLVDTLPFAKLNANEAYNLNITDKEILVQATDSKGAYWAIQTLRQLHLKKGNKNYIEGCVINDYPAFRIRGFMQDVGRSYISIEELKREIKTLSQYKINVFHWHLTENLGWRLESRLFPAINDSTSYERMHGMYYTQEEARDLVNFCKQHNVLLIPEIDMPGHSLAFRKAFRHDMQSKEGMIILKLLMDEVCEVFDVPYIHIGTDEVAFTNSNFVPEMVKHIRAKGKKIISWNPGWKYELGEIDMTHLWSYRGKSQEGIPAIDSRFHYINHFDTFSDMIALYNSRILNHEQGNHDIAGAILAFWHDRYVDDEQAIINQNNFYPSLLAMAERAWLGGGTEYFDKNGTILPNENTKEFKEFADFERRLLWHKDNRLQNLPIAYVKQTNVKWKITDAFPNDGELTKVFPPEKAIQENYEYQGKTYGSTQAIGAGIYLRHVWGNDIVRTFYENPQPNHTAYAHTYVYSHKGQDLGLWMNFQNYGRSESDLPPPQGKWDYQESKVWLNDAEIHPPHWESSHTNKSNEISLTNENLEQRSPISVHLKKGWNKILIKLPVGQFSRKEIRLVKWMFTCVFVTPDGKHAASDIIYSPDKTL